MKKGDTFRIKWPFHYGCVENMWPEIPGAKKSDDGYISHCSGALLIEIVCIVRMPKGMKDNAVTVNRWEYPDRAAYSQRWAKMKSLDALTNLIINGYSAPYKSVIVEQQHGPFRQCNNDDCPF